MSILYRAHSVKTEEKYDLTLFFLTGQRGHRGERQKHRCIVHLIFIILSTYRFCEHFLFAELPLQDFKTGQEDLRRENTFFHLAILVSEFSSLIGLKAFCNVCHYRYIPNY